MARIYTHNDGDKVLQLTNREYRVLRALVWSATNNMENGNVAYEYEQNLQYFGLLPHNSDLSLASLKKSYNNLLNTLV